MQILWPSTPKSLMALIFSQFLFLAAGWRLRLKWHIDVENMPIKFSKIYSDQWHARSSDQHLLQNHVVGNVVSCVLLHPCRCRSHKRQSGFPSVPYVCAVLREEVKEREATITWCDCNARHIGSPIGTATTGTGSMVLRSDWALSECIGLVAAWNLKSALTHWTTQWKPVLRMRFCAVRNTQCFTRWNSHHAGRS